MVNGKPNLFRNKDFVLLFLGGLVSRVGNGVYNIALVWFVLELTGSGTATGTLLLLATLPGVLIGPFCGVVADRVNRKFLIISMDIVRGLIVTGLAWTVYTGIADFSYLAVSTVLMAISSSFFNPAVSATMPNLVDDSNLQQANSLNHFSMNLSQIVGYALGGILIAVAGVAGVFLIDGISFLISALSEFFIDIPPIKQEAPQEKRGYIAEIKFGVSYLYLHKALFTLLFVAMFLNFLFGGLAGVGLPYIYKEILGVTSTMYGIAEAIFPVGAMIGAIALSIMPEVKRYYRLLVFTLASQSLLVGAVGFPLMPDVIASTPIITIYIIILAILVITGTANTFLNVPIMVICQRLIPDNMRGRIFALMGTMSQALTPISMALVGFLIDRVAPWSLFVIAGALSLIATLYLARVPGLRTLGQPGGKPAGECQVA